MVDKPSDRNTKSQILSAYDDLLTEHKALEKQLQQLKQKPQSIQAVSSKSEVKEPIITNKMAGAIDTLHKLQLGFGTAINELSEKLTSKAVHLQSLQSSISDELKQLTDLHDLEDIQENTLDSLVQTYTNNAKTFEAERSNRQITLSLEIQDLEQAWEKEKEDHQRSTKERDEDQRKTQKREAQEYDYNLTLQRNLEEAEYEQNQNNLYQQLEEIKQTQQKQWAEREKELAQQEQYFEKLQAQVETIPQDKESAIQQAIKAGQDQANYEANIKADLRNKELEGNKQVCELRIKSLEQTIEKQEEQRQILSKQLDAALKQIQDLAVKAIEGTSNIQSYQAFKDIAIEQAKNPTKSSKV